MARKIGEYQEECAKLRKELTQLKDKLFYAEAYDTPGFVEKLQAEIAELKKGK